jgi:hypothetical protein
MKSFEEAVISRLQLVEREVGRLRVKETGFGVTDHGALTGLSDNDHPQYLLATAKAADSDKLDGYHASSLFRYALGAGDFAYANGATPADLGGIQVASFPNSSAPIIDFAVINNRPGLQLRVSILITSDSTGMLNYYCQVHRAASGYGFPIQTISGNLSISINSALVVHASSATLDTSAWNDGDLIPIRIYRDSNDANGGTGYILGVIIDWV